MPSPNRTIRECDGDRRGHHRRGSFPSGRQRTSWWTDRATLWLWNAVKRSIYLATGLATERTDRHQYAGASPVDRIAACAGGR